MTTSNSPAPHNLLRSATERQRTMLTQLEELVSIESPSENKAGVDRASHLVAGWFQQLGGKVRWHRQPEFGDLLQVEFQPTRSRAPKNVAQKRVLLLGHLDTVWPIGTLAAMPFRVTRQRAFGPGIFDMKAGVVMAVHALGMLREAAAPRVPVVVLLNSEEEVGSPRSRSVTEKLARRVFRGFRPRARARHAGCI